MMQLFFWHILLDQKILRKCFHCHTMTSFAGNSQDDDNDDDDDDDDDNDGNDEDEKGYPVI